MADPIMEHALSVWEEISQDPEHYAYYLVRHKEILGELSRVHSAERRGLEKRVEQGLEKVRQMARHAR